MNETIINNAKTKTDLIKRRKKVYLDQNYWIYFRDSRRGTQNNALYDSLYETIKKKVNEGELICPVSFPVLIELTKQTDVSTREEFIEVVKELSLDTAILASEPLYVQETIELIENDLIPPKCVWVNTPYMIGDITQGDPSNKILFEQQKNLTIDELACLIMNIESASPSKSGVAEDLNKEKSLQSTQPIKYWYDFEVQGLLDNIQPIINEARLHSQKKIDEQSILAKIKSSMHNKNSNFLGSQKVLNVYYAGTRSKDYNYKETDPEDSLHASYAIPYYDVMLTDSAMRHHFNTRPFTDYLNPPKIISSVKEAVSYFSI
ncbi:hypothetical protein LEP1GSC060_3738 [Leptospira weilii serovar Ranarum str. ICFT]|uniref:Uncharacterized protein n=1 Tax=Leptospira weilii serovar Ranarum str. ICFT TaxID=1218598 RepID=N1WSJ3_9LEPT|nr:hypothetical protein [Leptospira weilii]EMY78813.1 hypothetical protein LEP1GSC060_3738 [Leptospira weilii serovar Ranarum str. ICFT]